MSYRGLILQPTYRVRQGVPVVQLFGRLEEGPAFVVEDDRFRPYFFVPEVERARFAGIADVAVEDTSLRALDGTALVRVRAATPGDVPTLLVFAVPKLALYWVSALVALVFRRRAA